MTDKIYCNMNTKKVAVMTFCYLSKAFESVSHEIQLDTCGKVNVDNFRFKSYIHKISQSVRISEKMDLCYGAPQGSILVPILVSIYVNDLAENTNVCSLLQYADDS